MDLERAGMMDIHDLSKYVGVKVNTLYSWVSQKRIPYVKIGRLVKFDRVDIDKWLSNRKVLDTYLV